MSWRRSLITVFALLIALISLARVTNIAHAAPKTASIVPIVGVKEILGETSIDGPAIIATNRPATALAWTGTDRQRHLNLMTSDDGMHQFGNKHILPETSLWRPALAFIDSARTGPYGTIVLAWTGTDPRHTLNVEFIKMPELTVTRKITLWGETSFTAPALATINGDVNSDVYLSWAGTDPAHTLNVWHMTTNINTHDKHILWGWSSISRPNLSRDISSSSKGPLILSWTGTNNRIYFAHMTQDQQHWTMPATSPLGQKSAWAPSMIGFYLYEPNLRDHWLAWTGNGTTSTRRINVQYTQHYPSWTDASSMATLAETAISSPELAYNGDGTTGEVLITWTGTDYYHHLNIAAITLSRQ